MSPVLQTRTLGTLSPLSTSSTGSRRSSSRLGTYPRPSIGHRSLSVLGRRRACSLGAHTALPLPRHLSSTVPPRAGAFGLGIRLKVFCTLQRKKVASLMPTEQLLVNSSHSELHRLQHPDHQVLGGRAIRRLPASLDSAGLCQRQHGQPPLRLSGVSGAELSSLLRSRRSATGRFLVQCRSDRR